MKSGKTLVELAQELQRQSTTMKDYLPVFAISLLLAALLAKLLGSALRLPAAQSRTLVFSFGTRNSFVVLPLALALPQGMELAAAAIVLQALVELLGMVFCLWWVPQKLLPA